MIKLAIGIANTGSMHIDTVFSLCRALKGFPYDYDVIFKRGSILHYNREEIVKQAIENNCTHLLFLDTDMYFEKDAILRLIEGDKDIIGVQYYTHKTPSLPTAFPREGNAFRVGCGIIQEAKSVATGFMLINLKVFSKIKEPWFFWGFDEHGQITMGEDYWFCSKARDAGYKVWCDLSIPVKHIGDARY
jgi:GT2 family glycosyltransferase